MIYQTDLKTLWTATTAGITMLLTVLMIYAINGALS